MNPSRILGQVLLWAGFISAALAASSQLEFDFLSDAEKSAIEKLPEEFELPKTEVENLAGKSMDELTNEEFISLVDAALPVYEQHKRESETNITIDIDLEDESEYTDESEPPKTVAKNAKMRYRRAVGLLPDSRSQAKSSVLAHRSERGALRPSGCWKSGLKS